MQWWCVATAQPWTWQWRAYPGVWLFVAAMAVAYWRWVRPRDAGTEGGRPGAFYLGLALIWVALDWPVGALGAGYLASVHMVQFLLIAMIAPPLLLLGVPDPVWRAWAAAGGRVLEVVTHPLLTLASFTVLVAATHWPPVVDGLMASQLGNFALDATWLLTGVLFWWPVMAPRELRPWFGEPARMGYLIAATILNTGVFAYLTFTRFPLYATFELAPPVGTLSSRDDQIVAGLLMKIGGAVILWTAITIIFFRWWGREEAEG